MGRKPTPIIVNANDLHIYVAARVAGAGSVKALAEKTGVSAKRIYALMQSGEGISDDVAAKLGLAAAWVVVGVEAEGEEEPEGAEEPQAAAVKPRGRKV